MTREIFLEHVKYCIASYFRWYKLSYKPVMIFHFSHYLHAKSSSENKSTNQIQNSLLYSVRYWKGAYIIKFYMYMFMCIKSIHACLPACWILLYLPYTCT